MSSLFKNSHELRQHLKEHPSLTPPGMSLGNLLLECGVITPSQLEKPSTTSMNTRNWDDSARCCWN